MLMGDVMKTASFSLAEAKFSMSGDFTQVVIQSVSKAQIKIRTKRDNVAGENEINLICLQNILLFI
jgi:V-type H+-transporting ATPase subunit D